jgi:hypothetical protein
MEIKTFVGQVMLILLINLKLLSSLEVKVLSSLFQELEDPLNQNEPDH